MDLFGKHKTDGSLLSRLFRGGAWLGAGSAAEQGLRFARNMILTRILAPEALGLMAIVLSVNSLFQVLTGMWIKESVVQNPRGAERTFLNGVWFLAMGRAVALFGLAFAAAPWLADFYSDPRLNGLIRLAFISVLFQGALSPAAFVSVKQMRYSKWVLIQQGGGVLGVLITIALALHLKGALALVLGYIAEAAARCVLSYIVCPFRPRWVFDRDDLDSMLRFARGMLGMPLLMLVYTEGSTFVAGKLCSKELLGVFAMCLSLARIPGLFSGTLVDLLLPSFAEMQGDTTRLNQSILKITSVLTLPAIPAACAALLFGKQILSVAYGTDYSEAGLPFFILFCNEMLLACNIPIASLYVALGQTSHLRRFSLLRAGVLLGILYPSVKAFGLVGAAVAPLLAMIVAFGFQLRQLRKLTGLHLPSYFAAFLRGSILALPVLLGAVMVNVPGATASVWDGTFLSAAVSLLLYVGLGLLAWRYRGLKGLLWPFPRRPKSV